jgi:hypothetical protein
MAKFVDIRANKPMNNYQKLLNNLGGKSAPEGLYKAVLLRLDSEKSRVAKRRFVFSVAALSASVVAFVSAIWVMFSSLADSGFWKFGSLIFTDSGTVLTYWKQFSLSLIESFSVPEVALSLACVFAVMLSLKFLLKNRSVFSSVGSMQVSHSF